MLGDNTRYEETKQARRDRAKGPAEQRPEGMVCVDTWGKSLPDGIASAKVLMQEHACPACGTARRLLCEGGMGRGSLIVQGFVGFG